MKNDKPPQYPIPAWVKILIIACALPVLALPRLLSLCPRDSAAETFVWLYPAYVLLSAFLAWKVWPERQLLAYILLAVMVLTHAAMYILVDPTIILP